MIKKFNEFSRVDEGFWDWLRGKQDPGEAKPRGQVGITDSQVEDFYRNLEEFSATGQALKVEPNRNYTYSKTVENIQIALKFLGYELPKYGVDGYFGPETAAAIRKFNDDTVKFSQTDND